jgi:V-type H+-transporting ATPase subunit a
MKIAVILGVLHMSLGIFLKAMNNIYFKQKLELFHEFVPQILLLWALFGYMDVLIVIKWVTNYEGHEHEAPSIIQAMIGMILNQGEIKGRHFYASPKINRLFSILFLSKIILSDKYSYGYYECPMDALC